MAGTSFTPQEYASYINGSIAQGLSPSTIFGHPPTASDLRYMAGELQAAGENPAQIRQALSYMRTGPSLIQSILGGLKQSIAVGPVGELPAATAGEGAAGAGAAGAAGAAGTAWTVGKYAAIAAAIGSTLDFLKYIAWLLYPRNWLRAVEFVAGVALMIMGLRVSFQAYQRSPRGRSRRGGRLLEGTLIGRGLASTRRRARARAEETRPVQARRARQARRAGAYEARSATRARSLERERKAGRTAEERRQRSRAASGSKRANARQARREKRQGEDVPF